MAGLSALRSAARASVCRGAAQRSVRALSSSSAGAPVALQPGWFAHRDGSAVGFVVSPLNTAPVPASAVAGWLTSERVEPETLPPPSDFIENKEFQRKIHQVVARMAPSDERVKTQALYQKTGWLHVSDDRNPPPHGRIPEVEDIIGSVLLTADATVSPDSYQSNPAYRLLTRQGFTTLPDAWRDELIKEIKA